MFFKNTDNCFQICRCIANELARPTRFFIGPDFFLLSPHITFGQMIEHLRKRKKKSERAGSEPASICFENDALNH